MNPEVWVVMATMFVCGGAIGSAGTLLAQWIVRKVSRPEAPRRTFDPMEMEMLRSDVSEMGRHLTNLEARLDFTEQLLGGAVSLGDPPRPLAASEEEEHEPGDAGEQKSPESGETSRES